MNTMRLTSEAPALLIELLTEELPPKALSKLSTSLTHYISEALEQQAFLNKNQAAQIKSYATPRRLAVFFPAVLAQAAPREEEKKLMPTNLAYDALGVPTTALSKRLEKENVSKEQIDQQQAVLLNRADNPKDAHSTQYVYLKRTRPGMTLESFMQITLQQAIEQLPIPKLMSYQLADGKTTVKFVRPAHSLIALHGEKILPLELLGLKAGNVTSGHRFKCQHPLTISTADEYEDKLAAGWVIADLEKRKALIKQQLEQQALKLNKSLGNAEQCELLLNEVVALVEHPAVYIGAFDPAFLKVPQECLILTMRQNQKYFPLFDQQGKLSEYFLIVSNMLIDDPSNIIEGNQRVVRPRLADAQFFFETDLKLSLAQRTHQLKQIIYHNQLGSQLDRVARLRQLIGFISVQIDADQQLCDRAALLSKADLNTLMVGEFPELQGVMGSYYAAHDGEPTAVIQALRHQYCLRAEDVVEGIRSVTSDQQTAHQCILVALALFIADRTETLLGIWSIGLVPTGDKDPFALRRAALGIISAFEQLHLLTNPLSDAHQEGKLVSQRLDLNSLLTGAAEAFNLKEKQLEIVNAVTDFIYERYRHQLNNSYSPAENTGIPQQGGPVNASYSKVVVEAVLALRPPLLEVQSRVQAVLSFCNTQEAPHLIAANKRIQNFLKRLEGESADLPSIQQDLLVDATEVALYQALLELKPRIVSALDQQKFTEALLALAWIKNPVDQFFEKVMVLCEDQGVRENRLALLQDLAYLMNQVADLSKLNLA